MNKWRPLWIFAWMEMEASFIQTNIFLLHSNSRNLIIINDACIIIFYIF